QHHTGLRKDGSTPEIQHQYEICLYLLTILGNSPKAPEIIAAALLHDLYEDYGVPIETIAAATSGEIAVAVVRLSKVRYGP
uniref:hypothetical protein n=1 Tax=Vibrio vulnificus TaxID=672 RepID=UPI0039B655B1